MGESEDGCRAIGQNDFAHKHFQVELIVVERAHIPFARIGKQALRAALSSPIDCCDRKSSCPQLADHFEIFFDLIGAAAEEAYRTLARAGGAPASESDRNPIRGRKVTSHSAFRHWVRRGRTKCHETLLPHTAEDERGERALQRLPSFGNGQKGRPLMPITRTPSMPPVTALTMSRTRSPSGPVASRM